MSIVTPSEGKTFIATYGSLRRGMHNTRVNQMGNGELVGMGWTNENYNLYDLGSFPSISLAHNSQNSKIRVEVYEAPNDSTGLTGSYDRLEGYPHFYNRTQVEITMDNGDTLSAWIYHIDEEHTREVTGGDWCVYRNSNYYEALAAGANEID